MPIRFLQRSLVAIVLGASLAAGVRAQVLVRQDFDGPEVTWREGRGAPSSRIVAHQRTSEGAHTGAGCEFFQFMSANTGTYAYLIHDLAPARVIAELRPTIWVRSDRTGIQLLARVVFPRSTNPQSGQPDSALVAGTSYTRTNSWEHLRIEDLPKLAAAQARVLRGEFKRDVDTREAFIDRLLLNMYTGAGQTRLWIDDLELAGFVGEAALPGKQGPASAQISQRGEQPGPSSETVPAGAPAAGREAPQLSGAVLLVGGRPFFPRAIEYQGEPLPFLKRLGFNTIRVRTTPSAELLADVTAAGMWLICPPPMPAGLDVAGTDAAPLAEITSELDCVLAWDLGEGLTGRELDAVKRWAEQVRRADKLSRPIIGGASAELRKYSAPGGADILLLDRFTPSTSFELSAYRRWLRERPRFARHGTPVWSTVPTETSAALASQVAALSGGRAGNLLAGTEQTRLVAYTALGSGARALIFASHSSLTSQDADTRWRASQLELLNLELELIEPWIASGTLTTTVTSSDHEIHTAVLQTAGTFMVLPTWSGKGAQYVPGHSLATGQLSFVVPGVPETISAYEVWPGGMRKIRSGRVAGGISVSVDDFGLTSLVLLAQDLMGDITRRTAAAGDRAARLTIEMAKTKLQIDNEVRTRLGNKTKAKAMDRVDQVLKSAQNELEAAEGALARGDATEAFRRAQFSLRNARAMERDSWLAATTKLSTPVSSPYAVIFATLPQHFALMDNVESARRAINLLPEGNFEDVARAMNAGWKHYQHPPEGVTADAQLSSDKHIQGKHSLRLSATAVDPESPPEQIETPPVWIICPELNIPSGTLVRLHGLALVPRPIKGTPDGLLVIDSWGGEALAERINAGPDWQEFTAYRMADGSKPLTVTIALTGLGEAWIDDLSVEPLVPRETAARIGNPAGPATAPSAARGLPWRR